MAKQQTAEELFSEFDSGMDEEEYHRLARSSPWLANMIARLVAVGISPENIQNRVTHRQPHNWILSQQVKAAARYIQRSGGENEQ